MMGTGNEPSSNAMWVLLFTVALSAASSVPAQATSTCDRERMVLSKDPLVEILHTGGTITAAIHKLDGGLSIICGDGPPDDVATDLIVYTNRHDPGQPFMAFFGDLAHRITGVSASEAQKLARICYENAVKRQANNEKNGSAPGQLTSAEPIDIKNRIHVDCRVAGNFTSIGVFNRRGIDDENSDWPPSRLPQ